MGFKAKLELDLSGLQADLNKAQAMIQSALGRNFGGGSNTGLATSPTGMVNRILSRPSGANGMRGYRDPMDVQPAMPDFLTNPRFFFSKNVPPTIASVAQRNMAQRASFLKNMGFAGIPLLSPGSLLGNMFASRQIFSGLSGPVGQGLLGKVGLSGVGGAAAGTAGIMGVLLAVGGALKLLEKAVKETAATFEQARKLYAKALTNGLGLQYTANRSALANTLGVSEKEVFQFQAAIAFLGNRLKWSSDIIARTTPNLTSVAYEFTILQENLKALFFTVANDLAPEIRKFVSGLSEMAMWLAKFHVEIGKFLKFEFLHILFPPILAKLIEKAMGKISDIGHDSGPAPTPQGMMKQLPVSALERMGLVIGGTGGANEYARRTASATEKTANLLTNLVQNHHILPKNFDMNNATSNP